MSAELDLMTRLEGAISEIRLVMSVLSDQQHAAKAWRGGTECHHIVKVVSNQFGVSLQQMQGAARVRLISWPRKTLCYLIRKHTDMSYEDLGTMLNRDHSTIMHAVQSMESEAARNPATRQLLDKLSREILTPPEEEATDE